MASSFHENYKHAQDEDVNITFNLLHFKSMNTDLDLLKHRALRRKTYDEYFLILSKLSLEVKRKSLAGIHTLWIFFYRKRDSRKESKIPR